MLEIIKAALIAVPKIVDALESLSSKIAQGRNVLLELEVAEQKEKIRTLTRRLENAPTKDELRRIVNELNSRD